VHGCYNNQAEQVLRYVNEDLPFEVDHIVPDILEEECLHNKVVNCAQGQNDHKGNEYESQFAFQGSRLIELSIHVEQTLKA
jgi:hypothetical protein